MNRIPQAPPKIEPLAAHANSPRWSVMIPIYNCAHYLPEALASVLSQCLEPDQMQIEVIDDASTDADVEALVRQIGKGRVGYFRQVQNVGSLRNFETCIKRAQGQLIHLLHCDDRVRPGYYAKIGQLFEQFPQAGAAFCRYAYIDINGEEYRQREVEMEVEGILDDWLLRIAQQNRSQYVSTVVKRSVYEHLGSFYGVTYGEDWEMWVRIARFYPVAYTPEVLADYRCHDKSISNQKLLTGQSLRDLRKVIQTIQNHLPQNQRRRVLKDSRKIYMHHGMYGAYNLWRTSGNRQHVQNAIREAFWFNAGFSFYKIVSKISLKILLHRYLNSQPGKAHTAKKIFQILGRTMPD